MAETRGDDLQEGVRDPSRVAVAGLTLSGIRGAEGEV
jgi:hypothetical protein